MLAQAESKSKAPFGNSNGRPDKSDVLDPQFAKLKKELTLAQREQISRTNYTEPRRTSQRNVRSVVPRARRMIHPTRRLLGRGSANKLSEPRHRGLEPISRCGVLVRCRGFGTCGWTDVTDSSTRSRLRDLLPWRYDS
jgi:hypothetical protein